MATDKLEALIDQLWHAVGKSFEHAEPIFVRKAEALLRQAFEAGKQHE